MPKNPELEPTDGLDRFDADGTNQAFRRTFLHECPAEMVPALSVVGYWLHLLALEYGKPSGGWYLVPRLHAALEELKFLHSFLASLDDERNTSVLESHDLEVSHFAGSLLRPMAKLIERIERWLTQLEGRDEPARSS